VAEKTGIVSGQTLPAPIAPPTLRRIRVTVFGSARKTDHKKAAKKKITGVQQGVSYEHEPVTGWLAASVAIAPAAFGAAHEGRA